LIIKLKIWNMTPKQKAEQLVALFEITAHPTIDMDKQISKTCALKCVDEVLNSHKVKRDEMSITLYAIENIEYWSKVKDEIAKIKS